VAEIVTGLALAVRPVARPPWVMDATPAGVAAQAADEVRSTLVPSE